MPSFEDQMSALEAVVERLEHGELPLEESVRLFEEGMRLTAACRGELDAAEGRLQVLSARPGGTMVPVDMPINANEEDEE
jgi:exodeoxyribonuclease VII small subunit